MDKSRLLRMLIVADVLLAFGSVGAQALFGWTLPPALAEFARDRFSRSPGLGDVSRLLLLGAASGSAFVAWIGLATFWRPARRFYIFSLVTSLLYILVSGPTVHPSIAAVFNTMSAVTGGVILGLVYFSDLAPRFASRTPQRAATAGSALGTGLA